MIWDKVYKYRWKEIEEFRLEKPLFCVLSNGTPDMCEYFKYKGELPAWATHFYVLPPVIINKEDYIKYLTNGK